ncbi:MAG: CvpA family protein [Bacteroidales bacterium]|nr:CvpA family protein [Bacteroidales bacterium]
MNYLDIIIAIVLFFFGFRGYKKGLVIEVVSLASFVVGIWGAMHFSDFTAAHLSEFTEINPKYINTVAFILTFILLVILVNLIGKLVMKFVKTMNLSFFNRLGGSIFGAAKGILLCSLLVMVLNNFQLLGIIKEEVKQESLLYPFVEESVPYIYQGFDLVKEAIEDLNESLPDLDSIATPKSAPEAA